MKKSHLVILAGAVGYLGMAGAARAVIPTVDVTPANMGNWALYHTDSGGTINAGSATADMVTGPLTPPAGTGSAHFQTAAGLGNESGQLRYTVPSTGILLSTISEMKYSTFVTSYNGSQAPFINLYVDFNGNFSNREDRLWFEPTYSRAAAGNGNPNPQPATAIGVWQNWDALDGMWYDEAGNASPGSGAKTWSALLALLPVNATLINDPGQGGLGGIRVGSGFASAGDNYNTNVDSFILGVGGVSTSFNFEPNPVPEPASLGILGAGALFLIRRKRAR